MNKLTTTNGTTSPTNSTRNTFIINGNASFVQETEKLSSEVGIETPLNLFNQQLDRVKLEFINNRMIETLAENEQLRERHHKREQETHEFVAYFQKEIQSRDKQITKLNEDLANIKLSHSIQIDSMKQLKENDIAALKTQFSNKDAKVTEQIFLLKEQLAQLETFRDMRHILQTKMADLQNQLQDEQEKSAEQLRDMERKFLEEKTRLTREHEKIIDIVQRKAKEEAKNGLGFETRKILVENRRLAKELRIQLQITEELQKDNDSNEKLVKKQGLELGIAEEKEKNYATAAQKQTREIRQLKGNMKDLETRASESLAAIEKERHKEKHKSNRELEDISLDIEGLRNLLRLKNKELRNIKKLAQVILDQRTEVEEFFLEALDYVKKQIQYERKAQRELEYTHNDNVLNSVNYNPKNRIGDSSNMINDSLLHFPRIHNKNQNQTVSKQLQRRREKSSQKVEDWIHVKDLSWEERERVLRIVFAKINGFCDAPNDSVDTSTNQADSTRKLANTSDSQEETNTVYFATEPIPPSSKVIMSIIPHPT